MGIKWKRVLIAGILAEALLLVIRIPITLYFSADPPTYIGVILWFGPMFLGGLWVAQKIESRYILHGVLVGIIANVVFFPMALLFSFVEPTTTDQSVQISNLIMVIIFIVAILVKIFGCAAGSYIGGKMSKNVHENTLN